MCAIKYKDHATDLCAVVERASSNSAN